MANKTNMTEKYMGLRASVVAVASCLALSGIPLAAYAAGLGKIVVHSALGQTLRAEIEVSATREELADMKAQLASPEAFKQAGLDYATTLLSIRFNIDKRANGQSVIRLSSDRPINDPFVDMLLELNWPAGRLVREYTFLLDPPEVAAKAAAPVVSVTIRPAASKPVATAPAVPAQRAASPIDDELRSKAVANVRAQQQKPAEQSAASPTPRSEGREVKRGDTLNKIASETKPEGVSLEQMLVGLLRANQDAFDGGNMNRLKAGRILSLPDKSALEAVPAAEARKIVRAQSSDWNAYRSRLAGVAAQTPVKEATASQESAGKITAKVEDQAKPAADAKDQLKVSASQTAAKSGSAAAARSEEDQIAKAKALAEAQERTVALEKNVADLQKLVELKNQNLAELQKQSAAKPEPTAPPPSRPEPAAVPPVEVNAPEPAIKPEATPVVPPPAAVEAPKPVAPVKPVTPPPPPPAPEPGMLDPLLDNPMALAAGGGILALLAALLVIRRRRASQGEAPLDLGSSTSQPFSGLTANSVFRSTGGQSVDTSHGPAQTDFSQAGPGSIDTDEVDPVAEADVYMAYGRDVQAEEILVEARQKDPTRYAIHLKLLEIYSNRKDLQQFETLATDLYGETGGVGADWEKAAAMGLKLDPGNPLFGASAPAALPSAEAPAAAAPSFEMPAAQAPAATPAFDANATLIVTPSAIEQAVDESAPLPAEVDHVADAPPAAAEELASLDFDLGLEDVTATAAPAATADRFDAPILPEPTSVLDFDLAAEQPVAVEEPESLPGVAELVTQTQTVAVQAPAAGLDFDFPDLPAAALAPDEPRHSLADLDFDLGGETNAQEITEFAPVATTSSGDVVDFPSVEDLGVKGDLSLTESTFLGQSLPEPSFDLSAIDLDLKEPEVEIPPPAVVSEPELAPDSEFETAQASTAVNPNFESEQAETLISPRPMVAPDAGIDFSVAQGETLVDPHFGEAPESEFSQFPESVASEEVTTKLDLANAYEEMGDFEGARELLQEVLKEGDATQREKAQAILTKIGQ